METTPEGNMAPRQGWWSRNWKWVVPVGCLGILASCGCLGAIAFGAAFSAMKSTGAYAQAVAVATSDAEVQEALGTPIETGLPQGSVKTENNRGTASLAIPLDGPQADGTLQVEAIQRDGEWSFTTLQVDVPGRPPIDLRDNLRDDVGGGTQRELEEDLSPPPDERDGESDINL